MRQVIIAGAMIAITLASSPAWSRTGIENARASGGTRADACQNATAIAQGNAVLRAGGNGSITSSRCECTEDASLALRWTCIAYVAWSRPD
jgi:hypothetical protein